MQQAIKIYPVECYNKTLEMKISIFYHNKAKAKVLHFSQLLRKIL